MPTRLLLVEDNPGDAVILREKLNASDLDFELVHVKRLKEGLEQLAAGQFDLLLVDLSLPDASGMEAVVKVREVAPDRPLIVLTGLDDATAAAQAKQEGAVDYLVKWYVDSVSLARYIRYAIAQYRMFPSEEGHAAGDYEAVVSRGVRGPRVVEGNVVRTLPPEPAPRPERAPAPAQPAADPLREALTAASSGVVVVGEGGRIAFANAAAKRWVGRDGGAYPWPVEEGLRRVERGRTALEQRAVCTTWDGAPAHLVYLAEAAPAEPAPAPAADPRALVEAAQAALAYVERAQQQSAWMADLLRSVLDLYRMEEGAVTLQPDQHDVYDLAQHVARDLRDLAMRRGVPLRVTSARKKVMAFVDRNAAGRLLRRLTADAVQTAERDGVRLRVDVEGQESVVRVEWARSPEDEDLAAEAGLRLGRDMVERLARHLGGTCAYEADRSGNHVVSVRLPSQDPA